MQAQRAVIIALHGLFPQPLFYCAITERSLFLVREALAPHSARILAVATSRTARHDAF